MRRYISKGVTILLVAALLLSGSIVNVRAESTKESTTRVIYVVYDNSGSMYGPGNMAWSQAAYAMEVFAAMMNFENGDQMKIFPMHNVTINGGAEVSSIIVSSQADIEQIHNMYTPIPGGTPYTQVNNAAAELTSVLENGGADEGWLVVLTDGDFDSGVASDGLKADLEAKASARENLYVQYLAVGSAVSNIPEGNADIGFYSQKAGSSSEVISELADISNRIFRRNMYTEYEDGEELEFDVPMSKIIVFAQGKDVSINSLKNEEGGEVELLNSCNVSVSSTDGAGLTSYVTEAPVKDTSLKGEVAVFSNSTAMLEGNYVLDVSGADTVNVYYEPEVKFDVGLYAEDERADQETITGGRYTLKVGFVNQLTGEFIESSGLLGEPQYKVTINGEEVEDFENGGTCLEFDLDVGGDTFSAEAEVTYLNDYKDQAGCSFGVCTLDMEIDGPEKLQLKSLEDDENTVELSVTKNGEPLTEEQWEATDISITCTDSEGEEFPIEWEIKKGKEVSTWQLSPRYKNGDMFKTGSGDVDMTVSITTDIDGVEYGSAQTVSMNIKDDKTVVDFLKRYWKQIAGLLALLILILGYLPPFKKRFPRKMKTRPTIECAAEKIGIRDTMVKGSFEKNLASSLIPYKAEVGRLTFAPAPVKKTAKLKATGGSGMVILNTEAFAGKENITFNGMSIPENYKGSYRMSASTIIAVSTAEFTYTCIPNVQRTANGSIKKSKGKKRK